MVKFDSKNPQFFLRLIYFFLNQLFLSFKHCFWSRNKSIFPIIIGNCGVVTFFVLFCNTFSGLSQQTAIYSQYEYNLLTINPAYAGSSEMVNLVANSRQQWYGSFGGPKTTVFGADLPINFLGNEAGAGIVFSNDQIGFFNEIAFNLIGSSIFQLRSGTVNVGMNVGILNHVIDPEWYLGDKYGLTDYHSDQDALIIESKETGSVFDMGVGAYYHDEKCFIGLSIVHLFNPAPEFEGNYYHYFRRTFYLAGGYEFAMNDYPMVFKPSSILVTEGASMQCDLNINALYKKRYWGGLGYRFQDALILNMGIEMKNGLKIGYSYDIPVSSFSKNYGGSHEIFLGFQFDLRIDKKGKSYKSVRYL